MNIVTQARQLVNRANTEAHFAVTLLQARGAAVALTPPLRYIPVLRALEAYGPAGAALAMPAAGQGDRAAIIDERGALTFSELDRRTNALANALRANGFNPGDSIGILTRNHRGLFEAIFAGAKVGARTLLLNTEFSGPQLSDVCNREDVTVLIHDDEFSAICASYNAPLGRILAWTDRSTPAKTIDSLVASVSSSAPPRPNRRQRIVLLTSGTTGTPKGAGRDMATSLVIPGGYLSKIPIRAGRIVVLTAPAFHAWGLLSSLISLGLGNTLVLARRFDAKAVLAVIDEHRADVVISVPILLTRLLGVGTEELSRHDLSSLRVVALSGSALAPELATRAMDLLGDIVYNLYGSTEVAYATIATPEDLRAAPGTVGRPPYGTQVRLLDDSGAEVPAGATGRIFVGNSIQFEGYTGGGNKQQIGGLMSTGDVGHFDEAGRLFVDGRDDDMIISGGENVFPGEIEDLLASHKLVVEAAVVGVPDPDFGSRLLAYVVLQSPGAIDEDGLREFVKSNLARYKVPREVIFLPELPRNAAGKIVKRLLRET